MSEENDAQQLELLPTTIDSNRVILKFETTEHAIDATLIANTLLSFDKTIKGFAECKNLSGTSVNVENIQSGCIEIGAIISVIQTLNDSAGYISAIWNYLKELYSLYKFLKGQPPAKTEKQEDKVSVENHVGEKCTFNECVVNQYIFNGATIIGEGSKILSDKSISEVKLLDGDRKTVLQIPREELSDIVPYKKISQNKSELISEETHELVVATVNLENPRKNWTFISKDGNRFSAKIQDESFVSKIIAGAISFRNGDKMTCNLEIIKRFVVALDTYEVKSRIIKNVIQYTNRIPSVPPELPGI